MGVCKKIQPKTKETINKTLENIQDKADIERLKKLLSDKIRDPKTAKKAAYIIAEMLNKKS